MTARTPPGRSSRSQAAYSSPASRSSWPLVPGLAQQPEPRQPATASAACPVTGLPGASTRAGPPGRSRATGYGTDSGYPLRPSGTRPRTRRPAAAAASATAGEQPPAAATRSPGTENVSMTRRAAAVVTGPPHGAPSPVPPGSGRPGQMLSGTPGPAPPAARFPAGVASGAEPAGSPFPAGL